LSPTQLIGLTFVGGKYRELFRHRLAARPATAIRAADLDGDGRPEVFYGTGVRTVVLSLRP
ncbi:MAG: VCBS repeat-containing protein, partial [Rhodospirillaceae bacterium]